MTEAVKIISETIGFGFERNELQSVNADDLIRLAGALAAPKDAEIERLREALKPFAEIGTFVLAEAPPEATMWHAFVSCDGNAAQISLQYFRDAQAALGEKVDA